MEYAPPCLREEKLLCGGEKDLHFGSLANRMSNSALHCSVLGCTDNARPLQSKHNVALHPAPRDTCLRRVWLQRSGLPGDCKHCNNAAVFVCGRHFAPDDYERLYQKTKYAVKVRLKSNAVPTLLLPSEEAARSNAYKVHTLGSRAKTGHHHVVKVKASTQTDVVTRTTTTQTKTKKLRSQGTNTGLKW
nr:uncharacterized protein LOC126523572 isoform X1 [Dermacentor andersoni]